MKSVAAQGATKVAVTAVEGASEIVPDAISTVARTFVDEEH
jgi:hypothetical protein